MSLTLNYKFSTPIFAQSKIFPYLCTQTLKIKYMNKPRLVAYYPQRVPRFLMDENENPIEWGAM